MSKDLAVGLCFYNPLGFDKMDDNLVRTTNHLLESWENVWVIELLYAHPTLNSMSVRPKLSSKVKYVQLKTPHLMWHKEQLLNYLARYIDATEGCNAFAAFDADILFTNPDWPQRIISKLEDFKVVQCYSKGQSGWSPDAEPQSKRATILCAWFKEQQYTNGYPGGAWAMRSNIWTGCGLFDLSIIGGGDTVFASALLTSSAKKDHWLQYLATAYPGTPENELISASFQENYLSYREKLNQLVGGSYAYTNQEALFQEHGLRVNRCHSTRFQILRGINFKEDLRRDEAGLTLWTNPEGLRAKAVLSYFHFRNTGGDSAWGVSIPCTCKTDCIISNKQYYRGKQYELPVNHINKHFTIDWNL